MFGLAISFARLSVDRGPIRGSQRLFPEEICPGGFRCVEKKNARRVDGQIGHRLFRCPLLEFHGYFDFSIDVVHILVPDKTVGLQRFGVDVLHDLVEGMTIDYISTEG